jgi:hypothetical protein
MYEHYLIDTAPVRETKGAEDPDYVESEQYMDDNFMDEWDSGGDSEEADDTEETHGKLPIDILYEKQSLDVSQGETLSSPANHSNEWEEV